jgi:hypothetical protein
VAELMWQSGRNGSGSGNLAVAVAKNGSGKCQYVAVLTRESGYDIFLKKHEHVEKEK